MPTTQYTDPTGGPLPIGDLAASLNIPAEALLPYGRDKAKVALEHLESRSDSPGKLVLVTAVSPTPAGEGKTTTSIGLADGLRRLGHSAALALREPSMGPVFGMKGGATGGGKAQLTPAASLNLHFTGDFAAIAEANNLLVALTDNHIHHGNQLNLDPRRLTMRRAIDLNDRALRGIVMGLGGRLNGVPREGGFDITAASEVMASFCLAESLDDLRERLGKTVVGYTYDNAPVTADDLGASGAMTAVLLEAFAPNLVQTLEGTPVFVHGGPFANIAHGCNSVLATRAALAHADIAITEAGFGADLGAEKFIDIKCRQSGLRPEVTVIVATIRAIKFNGGIPVTDLETPNSDAVAAGLANLDHHVQVLQEVFGQSVVVGINQFAADTDEEMAVVTEAMSRRGVPVARSNHFAAGGEGAEELAHAVLAALENPSQTTFAYDDDDPLVTKAEKIARSVYGAADVTWSAPAAKELKRLTEAGLGHLPVCMAKTQYSLSTDPKALGAPRGHTVDIREVRLSAGAGFVVLISGAMQTMPGLPKRPASMDIDVVDGEIVGLR